MKPFSQREGLKSVKSVIQIDSMDEDLRVGLWNALTVFYWDQIRDDWINRIPKMYLLLKRLWLSHFKLPLDSLDLWWSTTYKILRKQFFECQWFEVYDFIEFISNNFPDENGSTNLNFVAFSNLVMKRELSAYRFVGGKITRITSEEEISEIDEALKATKPFKPVQIHLNSALDLLADRESPDYRNSIKESISAVESICKLITGNPKATLGQALKIIENKLGLHSALKNAFSNLYGYTSAADGIRHALLDEPNLDFEDAKFMFASCAAFTNYLISKSSKAGIKL